MRSQEFKYAVPIAFELVGILMIAIGVSVELSTSADIGHMFITLGSMIIAVGGLLWSKVVRKP